MMSDIDIGAQPQSQSQPQPQPTSSHPDSDTQHSRHSQYSYHSSIHRSRLYRQFAGRTLNSKNDMYILPADGDEHNRLYVFLSRLVFILVFTGYYWLFLPTAPDLNDTSCSTSLQDTTSTSPHKPSTTSCVPFPVSNAPYSTSAAEAVTGPSLFPIPLALAPSLSLNPLSSSCPRFFPDACHLSSATLVLSRSHPFQTLPTLFTRPYPVPFYFYSSFILPLFLFLLFSSNI